MAHAAQLAFCREVKQRFPDYYRNVRVLEIGARDFNGSLRGEFEESEYVGVDCQPGKGVDVVCLGHDYRAEPGSFDVVYATEVFEHDPHARQTVLRMLELLRSGGLFFMTCAGEGRPEHGTARTGKRYGPDAAYYRNVGLGEFLGWTGACEGRFRNLSIRHNAETCDLYFVGIKAEAIVEV